MSTIYFVHAATSVGRMVARAGSHATLDEARNAAAFALSSGSAFVWIVDGGGNLILPPGEIRAHRDRSARAPQGFAR